MAKIESQLDEEAEGCFTSMIDIVFLLLIFFILQPFKMPEFRVMAYLPKDSGRGSGPTMEPPKPPVRIHIQPAGAKGDKVLYTVGRTQVKNGNRLVGVIKQESGGMDDTPIALSPSPKVHFQYVLKALDQCSIAGMTDVKFEATF